MIENEVTTVEQDAASSAAEPEAEPVAEVIQVIEVMDLDRPFLTTSFEDYTVTEGLLLLLLLLVFLKVCTKVVKGGFSWLWW